MSWLENICQIVRKFTLPRSQGACRWRGLMRCNSCSWQEWDCVNTRNFFVKMDDLEFFFTSCHMSTQNQEMSAIQWKWANNPICIFLFLWSIFYEKQIMNAHQNVMYNIKCQSMNMPNFCSGQTVFCHLHCCLPISNIWITVKSSLKMSPSPRYLFDLWWGWGFFSAGLQWEKWTGSLSCG